MKLNNSLQLKLGVVLSYAQMAINLIIGLLYTPIMIRLLGQSEYGLYNTVASTIAMLSILRLGFNSSYIRFFSKYKKENDIEGIAKLNGLFILVFFVIGTIALFCGLFLSFNLQFVFSDGLTISEYKTATVLMLLLTVNLALSFPMSVFTSIISAHEKFVFLKLLGAIKTVASPIVTLPLLLMGYKSIALVLITVFISLSVDLIYLFYTISVLKIKFSFGKVDKMLLKDLFSFSFFIALNLIVDQINWNIDKFLLGRFKGTVGVAIYSVGYTLFHQYSTFSSAISGVFTPRVHKIVTTSENAKQLRTSLTALFTRVGRIQFIVLALIASGIVFFGKPFIVNIWAGKEYGSSYYVAVILILSASIALIQNVGIEIQRSQNLHRFRSVLYFFMAIINLVLSIFLCQYFGAIGAATGTAFSLVVANGLVMNIFYHKKCHIDIVFFWKNILQLCVGLIIPVIIGFLMMHFVNLNNIFVLMCCILIYTVIYCSSMWFFGLNLEEKRLIKKPINKLLRKKVC